MNTKPGYVIAAVAILVLAALASWLRWGHHRLSGYVIGVIVAWSIVLAVSWIVGGPTRFDTAALVCGGFAIGMLAMYIATQFYGN
jgi:hypothetical protein